MDVKEWRKENKLVISYLCPTFLSTNLKQEMEAMHIASAI